MFSFEFVTTFYASIVTAVIAIFVYVNYKRKYSFWKQKGVPGPTPLPILGTAYPFYSTSMQEVLLKWVQKYGHIYGNYDFLGPVLMVSDPKVLKQIFVKDFHIFTNRREMKLIHEIFAEMMFGARDQQWKRLRKLITPTFSTGKIKKMKPMVEACLKNATEHLDMIAEKHEELNVKQFWGRFTLEVIARCCFAMNINSHKDPDNEFFKRITEFFKAPDFWKLMKTTLVVIFPTIAVKIFKMKFVNMASVDYVTNVTKHLLKQRKEHPGDYSDFFQLLIDAGKEDEVKSEASLTESEIIANCFLFFVAGYETTANLLNYVMYVMVLHPEVQDKLYEEIKDHFPDEPSVDYDVAIKLPYLDAVVSETLRMYPPFTLLERMNNSEVELDGTGIVLPAKSTIQIPVYAIHHDPEFYPEPHLFKPERFSGENRENIDPYTYLPFGLGPRNCVAMRFALIEAKLAIIHILLKFRFEKSINTSSIPKFAKFSNFLICNDVFVGVHKR